MSSKKIFTFVLVAAGWEPVCAAACAWCAPAEGRICLYRQSCPYLPPLERPARGGGLPPMRVGQPPGGFTRRGHARLWVSEAAKDLRHTGRSLTALAGNVRTGPPPSDKLQLGQGPRVVLGTNAQTDQNAVLCKGPSGRTCACAGLHNTCFGQAG